MVRSKKKSAPIPLYNSKKYRQMTQRHMTDRATDNDPNDDLSQIPHEEEPILSDEFLQEYGNSDDVIVQPKRKKLKSTTVELTAEEIKEATQQKKANQKKLQTLQVRQELKKKRERLYTQLQQHSIVDTTTSTTARPSGNHPHPQHPIQSLLIKSSQMNTKFTKRQRLQRAYQKEQMQIPLTNDEQELLYDNNNNNNHTGSTMMTEMVVGEETLLNRPGSLHSERQLATTLTHAVTTTTHPPIPPEHDMAAAVVAAPSTTLPPTKKTVQSLAAQMMASIVALSQPPTEPTTNETIQDYGPLHNSRHTTTQPIDDGDDDDDEVKSDPIAEHKTTLSSAASIITTTNTTLTHPKYVPTAPLVLHTTPSYAKTTTTTKPQRLLMSSTKLRKDIHDRPPDIEQWRLELPVVQMEYEIMELISSNDISIVCSETGSGKSTQIPQFLYEAGYSRTVNDSGSGGLIGITQPRRVAAISSAKRVCYEMGRGNGQAISKANVVSYQTRYESAGYSDATTEIQFMTDGILLQEIRNDLLLRKYNVIILDEAHERNLNTDILIGLLSIAIPLRNHHARQNSTAAADAVALRPLKLIIMSATLRVEDFTTNPKLFHHPPYVPGVITIPGRTFPVTVHHNKVTELYNYEDAVFQKTCKIHRQLPPGGILIFLTGKQEIVRMVNRLRRALKFGEKEIIDDAEAVDHPIENDENYILRDMDDDEVDGDLWQISEAKAEDGADDSATVDRLKPSRQDEQDDSAKPLKTIVLPLFSLLTAEQQARVFAPVPDGYRLIVVATNIAETSLTIPGITYVVDSGRQKCRNYNATTGVASFDIMWISKAAADQRAGRAGRTGPGHCYRIYSSSLYARHMDAFALPEVLSRPLEDVVLSMKAMNILNIHDFPFPTPPDRSQIDAAIRLLANIGCLDVTSADKDDISAGCDGTITRLGSAVAKLPLGVRYSKILLVAAEAGILDYAIPVVAALSEVSPFIVNGQAYIDNNDNESSDEKEFMDMINPSNDEQPLKKKHKWSHKAGDVLAALLAVGAYTYAGHGVGGNAEKLACEKFCRENGLHAVVMERIQQMRRHISHLAKSRFKDTEGVAARTGGYLCSMPPPNKAQERLLCQSIASGLLDNVAMLAPLGSIPGQHPFSLRSAYLSCASSIKEPLFMDTNSVAFSRDSRQLPKWICYESLIRKTLKDGITSIAIMKKITPVDPSWLGRLAEGSRLLTIGEPLASPLPTYDQHNDVVVCSVQTKFGCYGWEISPVQRDMFKTLELQSSVKNTVYMPDDSFRWFARFLLEGKVFHDLKGLAEMYNDLPSIITRRQNLTSGSSHSQVSKVTLLVLELSQAGIDNAAALQKHWAEKNSKFLFNAIKRWVKSDLVAKFQTLWAKCVKANMQAWADRKNKDAI